MLIALPLDEKNWKCRVGSSFGRAVCFLIYDSERQTGIFVDNSAAASTGGAGIKAAQTIADNRADVLITPRLGEKAADVLAAAKIRIYQSIDGTAQENIDAFRDGKLPVLSEIQAGGRSFGGC